MEPQQQRMPAVPCQDIKLENASLGYGNNDVPCQDIKLENASPSYGNNEARFFIKMPKELELFLSNSL